MTVAMIPNQDPQEDPPNQGIEFNNEDETEAEGEPDFPHALLTRLDEMIHRQRWVVPVLPKSELELLLDAAIELCNRGVDVKSEACQRFFREGCTVSFTKILTDDAVNSWKHEIHKCILANCVKLIDIVALKISQDWFPLLELLAMVFNPTNKFHTFNATRVSETVTHNTDLNDPDIYARPTESRNQKGWLVDLINYFGKQGGFKMLLQRFKTGKALNAAVVCALLKPFGLCYEYLNPVTIEKYFLPIMEMVPGILENLSDEELKKEAKNEAKNDALSTIIKTIKYLLSRIPPQPEMSKNLETFRLKMILRLLQISSFNGKMNALIEVNKVISSVGAQNRHHSDEDEWLNVHRLAEWIKENRVLQIVLRDSLHQPQYVEKLDKIIRFIIKEKTMTLEDLDTIWSAQNGKHEAIVKNIHDLLAKLAWDFSPEQLDHLFSCFQKSWSQASKKQREKLLELIRRLAEDDKDGVMAHKVLSLLWSLAHSEDVPTEIMDQALNAHVKILDYSMSQEKDEQKKIWLDKCVDELKHDKWVLPALKQIREICLSFTENAGQRQNLINYRQDIISELQHNHSLVILIANNLSSYMDGVRLLVKNNPNIDPETIVPDGRYNHIQQVHDRLNFLRFLLKDGRLWLCSPQAKQIWNCLAEHAIFAEDREACFRWFVKLMGEDPDLDPEVNKDFFEENILQFDPTLLTESGMRCFDRFFRTVNLKEGKLIYRRRTYLMDDENLIGIEYIWKVVLQSSDDIALIAIDLLKDTYTNLGPKLQSSVTTVHEEFINFCRTKLKTMYDSVTILEKDKDTTHIRIETTKMCRVLKLLYEYIAECDNDFGDERRHLPLIRASRGKYICVIIRFTVQGRPAEDIEIWPHTNDTVGWIRRHVQSRLKGSTTCVRTELYLNNDLLEPIDDKNMICNMPIKDRTMLTLKLVQVGPNMASSPDSSSDSSTSSPQHPYENASLEAENTLPGVLMSMQGEYCKFLLKLADLGCSLNLPPLRDGARLVLNLIPADKSTVKNLEKICAESERTEFDGIPTSLDELFFNSSPSTVLYNLQVLYALLMPAGPNTKEKSLDFQYNFIKSGAVKLVNNMLTKNNFLSSSDLATKKSAFLVVLRIVKLVYATVGYAFIEQCVSEQPAQLPANVQILQQALQHIPNPTLDLIIRSVAVRLAQLFHNHVTSSNMSWTQFTNGIFPDMSVLWSILRISWAAASGHFERSAINDIASVKPTTPDNEDLQVCSEGMETLSVVLALFPALDTFIKDADFHRMVFSLIFNPEKFVRLTACEQLSIIATKCSPNIHTLVNFISMLFKVLTWPNHRFTKEYFQLLCGLLSWACVSKVSLPGLERLLTVEIEWLKDVRQKVLLSGQPADEVMLEGHLNITKELVAFLPSDKKEEIGGEARKICLIKELVEDFIFPFSKVYLQLENRSQLMPVEQVIPVCSTQPTVIAAYDLLVTLCTGCCDNLHILASMLVNMYYLDCEEIIGDWEYVPPVGPRPPQGFVGLKNAGATCYMNSVLQQLYMIREVREGVLGVEGAAIDYEEDFSGEERAENDINLEIEEEQCVSSNENSRKEYHIGILKQVQAIFGHLACSKLQYYVPRGLWKHFKLQGEPVNLREQHDACEFYNILVESINEAMKALGQPQILNKILGGSFSDQKICKTCPHRYSREEAFTVISIDIRNYSNLHDSLEQYVKGDLLEGDNAYLCEKCNKKVDTVKRICLKKLPSILAIQLKRFDYDWERECSIKFNDYFEFPRVLDMEPYTVAGLASNGELIDHEPEDLKNQSCSKYKLTGIVVHSGQASGGHYFSYIMQRDDQTWYKFDDGEVFECKMDDDEEMKNQCFGGEYTGDQPFDNIIKRVNCRPRKRWWNAYLLFYTRLDVVEPDITQQISKLSIENNPPKMPGPIERSVLRQNVKFMHSRAQYSIEYFQFMKKLLLSNHITNFATPNESLKEKLQYPEMEKIAMISTEVGSKFLFTVGFRTKKIIRGPASEWFDALQMYLRTYSSTRTWFAENILLNQPQRFVEYLLDCPQTEIRHIFSKFIVVVAMVSKEDPPIKTYYMYPKCFQDLATTSLSDQLLISVLMLLGKEVCDHTRHLLNYFSLFQMYAAGAQERLQLLKLNVVETLIAAALDDGTTQRKYQYHDIAKLYLVVSNLIRCCDVSQYCRLSANQQRALLPNPYGEGEQPLMQLQPKVAEAIFNRAPYIKKIIDDTVNSEDTIKLIKFLSWENPTFSHTVLFDILFHIQCGSAQELKPLCELLLHVLSIQDSWQEARISNAIKGTKAGGEEKSGLFDIINSSKEVLPKKAYQCIKCMVSLFQGTNQGGDTTHRILQHEDVMRKWQSAVYWLGDELDRNPYSGNQQYYNSWSAPAHSNETSNGYFLERSASAKSTLEFAIALCPGSAEDEAQDEKVEANEEGEAKQEIDLLLYYAEKYKTQVKAEGSKEQQPKGYINLSISDKMQTTFSLNQQKEEQNMNLNFLPGGGKNRLPPADEQQRKSTEDLKKNLRSRVMAPHKGNKSPQSSVNPKEETSSTDNADHKTDS